MYKKSFNIQKMASSSSSSTLAPVLSADQKASQLLLKSRAHGEKGFKKWMQDLRKQEEERFDGSKEAAKKAGNAMVLMWAFSAKRRLKKEEYPQGAPDLPAPVRTLVRSFLDLESLATDADADRNRDNLWKIALEKTHEDRQTITRYYLDFLESEAKKGKIVMDISAEVMANAPKLASTGEALSFKHVAYELRKRGYTVDGEKDPEGAIDDEPPHTVNMIKLHGQQSAQRHVECNLFNVREKTSAFDTNPLTSARVLTKRLRAVLEADHKRIANYVVSEFCIPQADIGNSMFELRRSHLDDDNFPKMSNGDMIERDILKRSLLDLGYFVASNPNFDDAPVRATDIALRIMWQ